MIYIWQNLDQGNTKITENNFPILTSASQKKNIPMFLLCSIQCVAYPKPLDCHAT